MCLLDMGVSEVDVTVIKSLPTYITTPCCQSKHNLGALQVWKQILIWQLHARLSMKPPEATGKVCTKHSEKVSGKGKVRDQ